MKLDLLVACKELLEFMGKSGTFYEFSIRIKVPLFKLLCFLVHIFFFKSISPNVLKFAWSHGLTPFQVFLNVKFLGSKAKKVALFPQIGRVKIFFFTHPPHNRICIRIYIFNFKSKKNITGKSIKNNKFAAARVKIFLVTRIFFNEQLGGHT